MRNALRFLLLTTLLGVGLFLASFTRDVPVAEADTSITAAMVDATGAAVPGSIPPRVIVDMGGSVPEAANWTYAGSFAGTEFNTRKVAAHGYIDAGFATTGGLVFTWNLPIKVVGASRYSEIEDVLLVVTKFGFGAPDAGASTLVLDVGRTRDAGAGAATLQFYAANVNLLTTADTSASSQKTITRYMDTSANTRTLKLTFTQSAKDLTTANAGRVDVYIKTDTIPKSR